MSTLAGFRVVWFGFTSNYNNKQTNIIKKKMSIIFQANECFLLSHKAAVNQTFAAKTPLGAKFSIRDELFEINVPYMRDNQPEVRNTESKKREKIKRKKDKAAIDQHPVWYELVRIIHWLHWLAINLDWDYSKFIKNSIYLYIIYVLILSIKSD